MSKSSEVSFLNTIFYRSYQNVFRFASYALIWRSPEVLRGKGVLKEVPKKLAEKGKNKVLIVTDEVLVKLNLLEELIQALDENNFAYALYDKTVPNPTTENVEEAYNLYKQEGCDCLLAFGGGSPIDCAKGVGIRIARPNKSLLKMAGILKVRKKIPYLVAVPTTAGTGSEVTIATVITDNKTHGKYPISDLSLIPHLAILDPQLTVNLPPHITSTTGMDTLTHAVEAYVGRSNTNQTRKDAQETVKLIDKYLCRAYTHGDDLDAREHMLQAAFLGGRAFTRAYIGYVHALAHALGGRLGIAHGLANAVLLPRVLQAYGKTVHQPLSELADIINLGQGKSNEEKANQFIEYIFEMNEKLGIPKGFDNIGEEDSKEIVRMAMKEAHPLYPVPKILSQESLEEVMRKIRLRRLYENDSNDCRETKRIF